MTTNLTPIRPGDILLHDFMEPAKISQNKLAREIGVPVARINDIIHGKRGITIDTAMRLAKYFGTSPEIWLELQVDYDLKKYKDSDKYKAQRF